MLVIGVPDDHVAKDARRRRPRDEQRDPGDRLIARVGAAVAGQPVEQHRREGHRAAPALGVRRERARGDHVGRRLHRRLPDRVQLGIARDERGRSLRDRRGGGSGMPEYSDERQDSEREFHRPPALGSQASGQKSGAYSGFGSSARVETITSSTSSGSSFQTERKTSAATRTAVPGPASITSSPSLN